MVEQLTPNLTTKRLKFKAFRTPLRFPGGKSRSVSDILELFPKFKEYREPMVGGGSVFLSAKIAFPERKYWINDINHDLYAFWHVCKENPDQLVEDARKLKNSKKNGKEIFNCFRYTETELTDYECALRYYILNRISFSGLVDAGGFSQQSFEKRFTHSSIDRINFLANELEGVKISNSNYDDLLKKEGNDVFIYLDPPYYGNKHSKLYGKRGKLHVTFDHKKLAEELVKCKHNWLVTYDDNEVIRRYYSFANIIEKDVSYGMNNVSSKKAPRGKEIFITNYKSVKQEQSKFEFKKN